MNSTASTLHFPESIFDLNFNNLDCQIVSNWTSKWILSSLGDDFIFPNTGEVLMGQLEPFYSNGYVGRKPNRSEVEEWFMRDGHGFLREQFVSRMLKESSTTCQSAFCKKFPWMGVSDLAGRGVSIIHPDLATINFLTHNRC